MTIMAIAGRLSQRMLEHYSHIRLEAKRRALDALSSAQENAFPGVVTTQSTAQSGNLQAGESANLLN